MSVAWDSGGASLVDTKWIVLALAAYSAGVGIATFISSFADSSPTADTVAGLPSTGSLLHSTGTTAGVMDLATAGALVWWARRMK